MMSLLQFLAAASIGNHDGASLHIRCRDPLCIKHVALTATLGKTTLYSRIPATRMAELNAAS
jgi:hypothetical protein